MNKERKRNFAYEALILLGVMALLAFITRLWPILLLVMVGILVAAIRLLFLRAKAVAPVEPTDPAPATPPAPPETERDIVLRAFGLLQRRVSEWVLGQFPNARWVWETANPREQFATGGQLTILLNMAGGYQRARVTTQNLQFVGLVYDSLQQDPSDIPAEPEISNAKDDPELPVNYELIAFEWVDKNLLRLNDLCNDALAQKQETLLILSDTLPHQDSWPAVCEELTRNGFDEAHAVENGIQVRLPQ